MYGGAWLAIVARFAIRLPILAACAWFGASASMAQTDTEARFRRLQDALNAAVLLEESQMRSALRSYLDHWLARRRRGVERGPELREGRRMRWLREVLEPASGSLSPKALRRVECALALTLGMDALGRLLVVAYTWKGDEIRLISARKATPSERRQYERRR